MVNESPQVATLLKKISDGLASMNGTKGYVVVVAAASIYE
jgi:hypothetical protein